MNLDLKTVRNILLGTLLLIGIIWYAIVVFATGTSFLGYLKGGQISEIDIGLKEQLGGVHHLTEEDLKRHPALEELFMNKKKVLRPTNSILDLIPGYFWGPEYAGIRISVAEDRYLMDHGSVIYEYQGVFYQYVPSQ